MSNHHRCLAIIGSTGSLGCKVFEGALAGERRVVALAGGTNIQRLMAQAVRCRPQVVAVSSRRIAKSLEAALEDKLSRPVRPQVVWGETGRLQVARCADDLALTASGLVGLEACEDILEKGGRVFVGTKEIGVVAGESLRRLAKAHGGEVLPLDSELTAVVQLMRACGPEGPRRVFLSASGGPLLRKKEKDLEEISVDEVVSHPVWPMGPKVSVDSATLFNKAMEIMVASRLMGVRREALSAIIHPQCRVHAALETREGALLVQTAPTDMLWAVGFALGLDVDLSGLCAPPLASLTEMTFQEVKKGDFPAFDAGVLALHGGGGAPAFLAGADEVLVAAFLRETLGYLDLVRGLVEAVESVSFQRVKDQDPLNTAAMKKSWDKGAAWAGEWVKKRACKIGVDCPL